MTMSVLQDLIPEVTNVNTGQILSCYEAIVTWNAIRFKPSAVQTSTSLSYLSTSKIRWCSSSRLLYVQKSCFSCNLTHGNLGWVKCGERSCQFFRPPTPIHWSKQCSFRQSATCRLKSWVPRHAGSTPVTVFCVVRSTAKQPFRIWPIMFISHFKLREASGMRSWSAGTKSSDTLYSLFNVNCGKSRYFPSLMNLKDNYVVHWPLSWGRWIQSTSSEPLKNRLNINLPSTQRSLRWPFPSDLPTKIFRAFPFFSNDDTTRPACRILPDLTTLLHLANACTQLICFLLFLPWGPNIPRSTLFWNTIYARDN
jgi:hypothetical protein